MIITLSSQKQDVFNVCILIRFHQLGKLGIGKGFQGSNPQSCSAHAWWQIGCALSMLVCQVIIRKV